MVVIGYSSLSHDPLSRLLSNTCLPSSPSQIPSYLSLLIIPNYTSSLSSTIHQFNPRSIIVRSFFHHFINRWIFRWSHRVVHLHLSSHKRILSLLYSIRIISILVSTKLFIVTGSAISEYLFFPPNIFQFGRVLVNFQLNIGTNTDCVYYVT